MRTGDRRLFELLLMLAVAGGAAWLGLGFGQAAPRVVERPVPPHLLPEERSFLLEVLVFDDFECPACGRFDERVGNRLRELAAADRILLRYHHTPLSTHSLSRYAAAGAACTRGSANGAARRVLHRDGSWMHASDPAAAVAAMVAAGDPERLLACMMADSTQQRLAADAEFGRRAGIHRVPTVWVDNRQISFRSYRSLLLHVERKMGR